MDFQSDKRNIRFIETDCGPLEFSFPFAWAERIAYNLQNSDLYRKGIAAFVVGSKKDMFCTVDALTWTIDLPGYDHDNKNQHISAELRCALIEKYSNGAIKIHHDPIEGPTGCILAILSFKDCELLKISQIDDKELLDIINNPKETLEKYNQEKVKHVFPSKKRNNGENIIEELPVSTAEKLLQDLCDSDLSKLGIARFSAGLKGSDLSTRLIKVAENRYLDPEIQGALIEKYSGGALKLCPGEGSSNILKFTEKALSEGFVIQKITREDLLESVRDITVQQTVNSLNDIESKNLKRLNNAYKALGIDAETTALTFKSFLSRAVDDSKQNQRG